MKKKSTIEQLKEEGKVKNASEIPIESRLDKIWDKLKEWQIKGKWRKKNRRL